MSQATLFCLAVVVYSFLGVKGQNVSDPTEIQEFLDNFNSQAQTVFSRLTDAEWTYYTNMTLYNEELMKIEQSLSATFTQEAYINATRFNVAMMTPENRRLFIMIMDIGIDAQTNTTKLDHLVNVVGEMEYIYNTAVVTMPSGDNLTFYPELNDLMATSRDYDELLAAWLGWRAETGNKMKKMYAEYVELANEAVKMHGHADMGAYMRSVYDTATFEDEVRALLDQLLPLYEQLHAYVRRKLKQIYGSDKFPSSDHIPAHLLGNMWAEQWRALGKELTPYKGKPTLDVTDEMVRQNYTALRIFQTADDFFKSLGMIPMPDAFWNKSLLEKPEDGTKVDCLPSAWDFKNGRDFRIKMCTAITTQDLATVHHEMGHIQYYLQYNDQPVKFRDGANPGFQEAIGDTIALSVQIPEHMHSIGLLPTVGNDTESDINFLMSMALEKIAFLPFGYLLAQWRWSVFRGEITPEKYNEQWWNLRCKYQGISSPVPVNSSGFDPGAKYHVAGGQAYISYFVSFVLQFQFHKALCDEAGYRGPLHKCNIYNSTAAGTLLSKMLKLGSSKPWPDAMFELTGQYKMDAQPLIDYFKPLLEYLRKENGDDYGWYPGCPTFTSKC